MRAALAGPYFLASDLPETRGGATPSCSASWALRIRFRLTESGIEHPDQQWLSSAVAARACRRGLPVRAGFGDRGLRRHQAQLRQHARWSGPLRDRNRLVRAENPTTTVRIYNSTLSADRSRDPDSRWGRSKYAARHAYRRRHRSGCADQADPFSMRSCGYGKVAAHGESPRPDSTGSR